MKKIFGILIILFSLILFSFQILNQQGGNESSWESFENEEYSFKFPKKWSYEEINRRWMKFNIVNQIPYSEGGFNRFQESFNLVTKLLDHNDLGKFYDESVVSVKKMYYIEPKVLSESKGRNTGVDFKEVVFLCQIGELNLVQRKRLFIVNNKSFVLTGTFKKESYDSYSQTCQYFFDNFILK